MANKTVISTANVPAAIGPYSQAIQVGNTTYCSGQLGLDPVTAQLVAGGFEAQVKQAFSNLKGVVEAAGGNVNQCVKLTLFLTDLSKFATVNELMAQYFEQPYPARSTIGVASLPKGAEFEVEAIMVT
jgi:2-iminobutanoate/2-iminopropanoate deaminase